MRVLQFVWHRVVKPRLLTDPVALARDLLTHAVVCITRPRRRP